MKKIIPYLLLILIITIFSQNSSVALGKKNTPAKLSFEITIEKGSTIKIKPAAAKKFKISVNKPKVVSVKKNGRIKALKTGKAKITIKAGKLKYVYFIEVSSSKGNTNIPDTPAAPTEKPSTVNILNDLYVSQIMNNNNDTWLMISYNDTGKQQSFSNSYSSLKNAAITLNGSPVDITMLQVGDQLEVCYTGALDSSRFATFSNLVYIKATR